MRKMLLVGVMLLAAASRVTAQTPQVTGFPPEIGLVHVAMANPSVTKVEIRFFWVNDPFGGTCYADPTTGTGPEAHWGVQRIDRAGALHPVEVTILRNGCAITFDTRKRGLYWVRVRTLLGPVETRLRLGPMPANPDR